MGLGNFIFELSNMFSIYRWNNRPSVIRFTEADNAFHGIMLTYVFGRLKDKNIFTLILSRIKKELPKIILSDISLETKNKIMEKNPKLWNEVIEKTWNEISEILGNNSFLLNHIQTIDDPYTKKLNNFVDLLTAYWEMELNKRVFPEFYEIPVKEVRDKIQLSKDEFENPDLLLEIGSEFLKVVTRMSTIIRWNRIHRNVKTTVAAHSFIVTTIAILMALNENLNEDLLNKITIASILHDFPESLTGDVITPTKKKVKGMENIVTQVEKDMLNSWLNNLQLNSSLKKEILDFSLNPFDYDYGIYVRSADFIAAMLECALEIKTGNSQEIFLKSFFNLRNQLKDLGLKIALEISEEIELKTFV